MPERWVVVVSSSVFLYVQIKLLHLIFAYREFTLSISKIFLSGMIEDFVV
jgi:E3 ubiquitin-protein ligase DOA10